MTFRGSLKAGKRGEETVIALLAAAGISSVASEGKFPDWDLSCSLAEGGTASGLPASFTVEVKNDLMEARTGNVCFELWNTKSGEPSGLTATKADLWAHVLGDKVWLAPCRSLRKFVEENPSRRHSDAGDGNAFIALYPSSQACGTVLLEAPSDPPALLSLLSYLLSPDGSP